MKDLIGTFFIKSRTLYFVTIAYLAARMLVREQLSPFSGGIELWIHQVYVHKEFRKKGIWS